jgi:hypothetical protein
VVAPGTADGYATGSGLQAIRLDPLALPANDLAASSQLADRAAEPNPFFRPEFVLANVIERGAPAELLVVRDDARWLACLPIRTRPPSLRLPVPQLEGLIDEYSLFGTPLIDRESLGPATDALIDLIRAERRAAVLVLGKFDPDGPVGAAIAAAAMRRGMRPIVYSDEDRAAWRRSSDPGHAGVRLNRSDSRELARRSRLLSTELGGELLVVDHSLEPAAWDTFLAMENSGWKAERGTALGSTAADAAFFRHMCAAMSAAGLLEVVALEVGGHTVAMECHLVDAGVLYSFKIAHEPEFRKFSPGTQLKYRVIESFHQRGLVLADSCAVPSNLHMNRLWPERRRMQTLLLPTGAQTASLLPPAMFVRAAAKRFRDDVLRRGRRSTA